MRCPLWRRRQDEELDEELASHLRMAIADRIERGERPDEAARAARVELGNVGLIKEVTRDTWGWTTIEQVAQDVRYACRTLRKAPGFTAVAILTLALGIGANAAMFSVINAVLLRPLPFPDPDRLVAVSELDFRQTAGGAPSSASYPNFFDWRSRSRVFDHLSSYRISDLTVAGGPVAFHLDGAVVSAEFFSTLGVQPVRGRAFRPEDERAGADVAVISDDLWQSQFGAASDVVGRTIRVNARPFTIVGVMPPGFRFPVTAPAAQLWITLAEDARTESSDDDAMTIQRGAHFLKVIGRLTPTATAAAAQAELDLIAAALTREYPNDNGKRGIRVASQLEALVGSRRQPLMLLLAAVACVLLIACVNLANLLLARGAGRSREISLRAALGASSRRIVSQLLTESLVLTIAGTACGLPVAYGAIAALVQLSPVDIRGLDQVTIDRVVLAFTFGVAAMSALAFGIVPALQASRTEPTVGLQGTMRTSAGRSEGRLRGALVVAETAVGVVLLVAAGLLLRNFNRLLNTSPGFDPHHVVTARFTLPDAGYKYLQKIAFYDDLLTEIAAIAGVQAVGATAPMPLSGSRYGISFQLSGATAAGGESNQPSASFGMVSPGYFRAMRVPLVRGREFSQADNDAAPRVVVVNESFARTYFPGQDAIGQRIRPGLSTTEKESPWREIVGVVGDVKHTGLAETNSPAYFVPYGQGLISSLYLVVRSSSDAAAQAVVEDLRKVVARKDPELALHSVKPLDAYLSTSVASERFETLLLAVFAGLGLVLTTIGLYGVVAYGVAQRTREFGIRLALGARPGEVRGMVVRSGMMLAAVGLAVGIVAAAAATRVLGSTLSGIDRLDPITFAAVACVLFVVAMLASYVPARRATRVDPIGALRAE
jgi:putative ABC transport system permease protein